MVSLSVSYSVSYLQMGPEFKMVHFVSYKRAIFNRIRSKFMNFKQKLSNLFYLFRSKRSKYSKIHIYIRITIDGLDDYFHLADKKPTSSAILTSFMQKMGLRLLS